jgi:hypothetical protein
MNEFLEIWALSKALSRVIDLKLLRIVLTRSNLRPSHFLEIHALFMAEELCACPGNWRQENGPPKVLASPMELNPWCNVIRIHRHIEGPRSRGSYQRPRVVGAFTDGNGVNVSLNAPVGV